MKIKHVIEIREAIEKWAENAGAKQHSGKKPCVVCYHTYINWEVFHLAKVRGDSVSFLAELYTYLTADQITKALMYITGIDGRKVSL